MFILKTFLPCQSVLSTFFGFFKVFFNSIIIIYLYSLCVNSYLKCQSRYFNIISYLLNLTEYDTRWNKVKIIQIQYDKWTIPALKISLRNPVFFSSSDQASICLEICNHLSHMVDHVQCEATAC